MTEKTEKTEWVGKMQEFFREVYEKAEGEGEDKFRDAVETIQDVMTPHISGERIDGPSDNPEWFVHFLTSRISFGLAVHLAERDGGSIKKMAQRAVERERKRARREGKEVVE